MKWTGSEKRASVYRLEEKRNKKKMGTEPIFIRFVLTEDHRRLWTFFYGTGKTGTSQVSLVEPFHFFVFARDKRPLKLKTTYPDSKDRSDLLGNLGELVAKNLLKSILQRSQAGTPRWKNGLQILTFSMIDHCTLAVNFLDSK